MCVCVQIRWLLEDEIVSALRHSRVISLATLQKVAEHVLHSTGQPHCHCEDVPLQFVFGPEQSLEKFKEARRHTRISLLSLSLSLCFIHGLKFNLLINSNAAFTHFSIPYGSTCDVG